ncbi:MAG: A/G-specific adenine glycosylase [Xanthomonadales bacterium]|nr:A/G-specific adenine glycosylase [Xanthomonadales bacterium]
MKFSTQLLNWWDKHGRKDLPWQHPRTAYRVWVSEIMLQQTQVKTVIPYFNRFIDRFPDIQSLAAVSNDDVLAYWSGLGYYARARNLLRTAKICMEAHDADLPKTPDALAALPGIGESTANAIYSQAFDKPAVILDGNVKRVLARYFAVEGWPGKASIHKELWNIAGQLLPARRGADYTQAIMDLGATLCTRTRPSCEECPVNGTCKAYGAGTVEQFPSRRPALKISKKSFQMLILLDGNGNVLLERRPPTGIWGGLWSLPADDDGRPIQQRLGLDNHPFKPLASLQHQLTHIKMTIQPLIGHAEMDSSRVECTPDQRWFSQQEWPALGLPRPVRHLLETYLENDGK